jgi:hypothetical protein
LYVLHFWFYALSFLPLIFGWGGNP